MGLDTFIVTYKCINVSDELVRGIVDNLPMIEDTGTYFNIPDPDEEGVNAEECLKALPMQLHEPFRALMKQYGGMAICIG